MTKTEMFAPSGFFVLRSPLLPFSELEGWGEGLEAARHDGDREGLRRALDADRLRLRERLREALLRPEMRDALFVASPRLDEELALWEKDPDGDRGRSLEPVLVAYYSRAAARATPFGLFAGVTTGVVADRTRLRLHGRARYARHSRLDMDYLWSLAEAVEQEPSLRSQLLYRPNSALYEAGGRLRMAEARTTGSSRSYHLIAIEKSPYLTATLVRASRGASLEELAAALVDEEISHADAEQYLDELVSSQLLVADVRPLLTGHEPGPGLVARLRRHSAVGAPAERLAAADVALAAIDADGVGVAPERYRCIADSLGDLPAAPQLSRLVQVDLTKPAAEVTLGAGVIGEISRGVRLLHALAPARPPDSLARFRDEFVRRYETREVPLVEALDEESGIGFERSASPAAEGSPLLAGLPLRGPVGVGSDGPRWTPRDGMLLARLLEAIEAGADEVAFDRHDVEALLRSAPERPLPDAFEVLAALAAESEEGVARGDFRVLLHSATGPSGARTVGRFCHVDHDLHAAVRGHLRAEEAHHPDRIYAEIVHLPEGRVGNILSRPVLRGHEIPYLGGSGAAEDRQIPVSDLLVSVVGDRIVLRSGRLRREVMPRLTTTHNYGWRSLGVYRFLCSLQRQGVASDLTWDWGPLGQAPFLPRVVAGRVVLARARWRLAEEDLSPLRSKDAVEQFAAVQRTRSRRRLPRYVALADGDNELVIDLDNVLCVEALVDQVKSRTTAVLVELFPPPSELCVSGPEGAFVHEVAIPFVRGAAPVSPAVEEQRPASTTRRRFPPGSEWLYLKLYGGTAGADEVLDVAGSFLDAYVTTGAADSWFFIRYSDPDPHLRLRVHGTGDALHTTVGPDLQALAASLVDSGHLWRVQLDTYEREVERYGGDQAVELAEAVFCADSRAALAVVRRLPGDDGADLRWRVALRGVDLLFEDLGLTPAEKRMLARAARDGYRREFAVGRQFHANVSQRFRSERAALEELLDPAHEHAGPLRSLGAAFAIRSASVADVGDALRALARRKALTSSLLDLAMSHAHMHVNRVLRSAHRAQELVLYEFLDRLYTAAATRSDAP